ncbi:hypothetical protein HYV50_00100 [Candidatus Pacearchaeota archaeon]|nr:hypothetical protein [Candidatus Pacearchaeota archaeon]
MAKQITSKKNIKKTFHEVTAPLTAEKIYLYATNKEDLINKTIKLDLTKKLRGKSLELKLRIKKEGEKLLGTPESIELAGAYIRRAMHKGIDYVEDSFEIECKDCFVRIKPLLLTRKRVSRSVLKALRENTKKNIESLIKTRFSQEIFSDIITNKLQKQLSLKLKKIYPLALCEIRIFQILRKKDEKFAEKK